MASSCDKGDEYTSKSQNTEERTLKRGCCAEVGYQWRTVQYSAVNFVDERVL